MRNNFFYILIICAFTKSFAKNEEKKLSTKEVVKHTREFYEEEAKKDIVNLLSSLTKRDFSEEGEDDDTESLNLSPRSTKIMERIDEVLKKTKSKKSKKKYSRTSPHILNLPLSLRNAKGTYILDDASNNQFLQFINRLVPPNSGSVKSRISGGHNANFLLRNRVNLVNIKPKDISIIEGKPGSRSIESEEDDKQISYHFNVNDEDELKNEFKLMNKHKNATVIRTAPIPMSDNFDLKELMNQLHLHRDEIYAKEKESSSNIMLHDLINHSRPGNRMETYKNHLDDLEDDMDFKGRDKSKTIILRSNVVDKDEPDTNKHLITYLNFGNNLRTSQDTLFHGNGPAHRSRQRRSTSTQAGYTQDPDTCKTYNENLGKLWSNLSKLINVTDQPNNRALHNIAMMIQAYLEHQNAKQPSETHKPKHDGPRDKITEVMLKIRKLIDEAESSAEKITKIIIKYLKPDYTEVESDNCQQVNEEYLSLSVDLLYKIYLENTDCQGEDESMARNKKMSLRQKKIKTAKALPSNGHVTLSVAASDLKPEFQTIIMENELYKDFHKAKMPRQRPKNSNRRVFKPSRKQRSHPVYRSGNQDESEKLKTRSKSSSKSASKRLKKSSLKSDVVKGRCEKYATRKLIVSLRPVMERFMGLLECQLDNTLRSVSLGRDSKSSYHLYTSKLYSNEDIKHHRKISPKVPAENTGRKRNKLHKKMHTERQDSSVENYQDRDDDTDSAWIRKYSFDQIKDINAVTPVIYRETDVRKSDTDKNKEHGNTDYLTTYNEYFQSPPLYDDYDGIYKTHKVTNLNGFPSLINPLISLNDKKTTRDKSTNKQFTSSGKEQGTENDKNGEYDTFDEDAYSGELNDVFNLEQQTNTESSYVETPFIDLTKLRNDKQLIEEKNKAHVKSFESITEFLKRAHNLAMQTPEFAVPFALDTNKGYVELTHLIKYPKMLVYRPQFLVKNTMPYDDFLKTINNINMTNDNVRLMKIVRHLPDSSVQVLFETQDFEAPLEVRNLNDIRRSSSPDTIVNDQFESIESRIDTANENNNADIEDGDNESLSPIDRFEVRGKDMDMFFKSDSSSSDEYLSPDFNSDLETLQENEKLSPNVYNEYLNSDSNMTLNSKQNSTELSSNLWFDPSPSSGIIANNPNFDSDKDVGSAVGSTVGSQIGSGVELGLDTALNLGLKLDPLHSSPLDSFFSKLLPSHSNTQSTSKPSLNKQSHIFSDSSSGSISAFKSYSPLNSHSGPLPNSSSGSHSLLPSTDSTEVGNSYSSSTQSNVLHWWRKWKNIVKGKVKQVIGKMASLTNKIDHIVKV